MPTSCPGTSSSPQRTGATIGYGRAAAGRAEFPIVTFADGDRIRLGADEHGVTLEIRETPGHTPESISIVVHDGLGDPYGVLTGDTLFIGDVGRPDLLASVGVTADDLARRLYHSLHDQLLTLPDATKVFPAHGAGSACGKQLSTETVSTIGEQRATNYALAPMSEDEFVDAVTQGQSVAPLYFAFAANRNRQQRDLLAGRHLGADVDARRGARPPAGGRRRARRTRRHDLRRRTPARVDQRRPRRPLRRVRRRGHAARHPDRARHPARTRVRGQGAPRPHRLRRRRRRARPTHRDLRRPSRPRRPPLTPHRRHPRAAHRRPARPRVDRRPQPRRGRPRQHPRRPPSPAPGAARPASTQLDRDAPTVVFCAGGYRSAIASSLLRAHGFTDVSDLLGGYTAWTTHTAAPSPTTPNSGAQR